MRAVLSLLSRLITERGTNLRAGQRVGREAVGRRRSVASMIACGGMATWAVVPSASATWSIILVDTRTGEVAAASATCLTDFDLQAITPVLLTGVGAATAQSFGDTTQHNRTFVRDAMLRGVDPVTILSQLATFDSGHQTRQYGMVDVQGRRVTFSGTQNGAYAGGLTGSFVDSSNGATTRIAYAVQGNVLTGAPVNEAALQRIISTPGDLAAKLMAGMEGARLLGGDGRCSCAGPSPTSCGAPPANFTKTAHIGYMLIARAGDVDGTHGMYRTGNQPNWIAVGDLTSDGRPEFSVATSTLSNGLTSFVNATPVGGRVPAFEMPGTVTAAGGRAQCVALADVTRDGVLDAVISNFSSNTVSMHRGLGNGRFAAPANTLTGTGPECVVAADFDGVDGPDLAVGESRTGGAGVITIRRNGGAGTFLPPTEIPVGNTPRQVIAADLDGDPRPDLAVALFNGASVGVLRANGPGTFEPVVTVATGVQPIAVTAGDFDGDGDTDLAAACQGAIPGPGAFGIQILTNAGGVFTVTQSIVTPARPSDVLFARGGSPTAAPRLIVPMADGRVQTLTRGGAGFVPGAATRVWTGGLGRGAVADFDGDGDLDAVMTVPGNGAAILVRATGETLDEGVGTAFGNYFMEFNIAFQSETAPDPVFQLRALYDAWRSDLVSRPDAVRSVVVAPGVVTAGATREITVTVRDWRGEAAGANSVRAEVVGVGAVVSGFAAIGGGTFRATVTNPGGTVGGGLFGVRLIADDGVRSVTLMPETTIRVRACGADADNDGGVTGDDLTAFLAQFDRGDRDADLDGDGGTGLEDLIGFLEAFAAGC